MNRVIRIYYIPISFFVLYTPATTKAQGPLSFVWDESSGPSNNPLNMVFGLGFVGWILYVWGSAVIRGTSSLLWFWIIAGGFSLLCFIYGNDGFGLFIAIVSLIGVVFVHFKAEVNPERAQSWEHEKIGRKNAKAEFRSRKRDMESHNIGQADHRSAASEEENNKFKPSLGSPPIPSSKDARESSKGAWIVVGTFLLIIILLSVGERDNNNSKLQSTPPQTQSDSIEKPGVVVSQSKADFDRQMLGSVVKEANRHAGGRSAVTYDVQHLLAKLGYDTGKPDGIYGVSTNSAIKAFQRDYGFEVDGRVSMELRNRLKIVTDDAAK